MLNVYLYRDDALANHPKIIAVIANTPLEADKIVAAATFSAFNKAAAVRIDHASADNLLSVLAGSPYQKEMASHPDGTSTSVGSGYACTRPGVAFEVNPN